MCEGTDPHLAVYTAKINIFKQTDKRRKAVFLNVICKQQHVRFVYPSATEGKWFSDMRVGNSELAYYLEGAFVQRGKFL